MEPVLTPYLADEDRASRGPRRFCVSLPGRRAAEHKVSFLQEKGARAILVVLMFGGGSPADWGLRNEVGYRKSWCNVLDAESIADSPCYSSGMRLRAASAALPRSNVARRTLNIAPRMAFENMGALIQASKDERLLHLEKQAMDAIRLSVSVKARLVPCRCISSANSQVSETPITGREQRERRVPQRYDCW